MIDLHDALLQGTVPENSWRCRALGVDWNLRMLSQVSLEFTPALGQPRHVDLVYVSWVLVSVEGGTVLRGIHYPARRGVPARQRQTTLLGTFRTPPALLRAVMLASVDLIRRNTRPRRTRGR